MLVIHCDFYTISNYQVRAWVESNAETENAGPLPPHSFTDLPMGLKKLLVDSRKHGMEKAEQKKFRLEFDN